jgi:hypothetical protein
VEIGATSEHFTSGSERLAGPLRQPDWLMAAFDVDGSLFQQY